MQRRDFSYLSVELHKLGEKATLYIREWTPTRSTTLPFEGDHKLSSIENTREQCAEYWKSAAEILEAVSNTSDRQTLDRIAIEIQELSVGLSEAMFHQDALNFIFKAARETEILVISTNLVEIPWEALVNPGDMNGVFLSQYCIVSRSFVPSTPTSRGLIRKNQSCSGSGLFVDAELLRSWSIPSNKNHKLFRKLSLSQGPVVMKNVSELFRAMEGKKTIQWICENSFESKKSIDRLRIEVGNYCTKNSLLTNSLSQDCVVLLITCCQPHSKRSHEPIPALLAAYNGCTVVCPLIPISEQVGIQLLRTYRFMSRTLRRKGTPRTLEAYLNELRRMKPIGSSTFEGMIGLFLGVYGTPRAELD